MNEERILKLADFVEGLEQKPKRYYNNFIGAFKHADRLVFDMVEWNSIVVLEDDGSCGTACCTAGAACILFAEELKNCPQYQTENTQDKATWLLGLTEKVAQAFFVPDDSVSSATPEQGAKALRLLADGYDPDLAWHVGTGLNALMRSRP